MESFTDEELEIAKSVDLCAVAERLGYTVRKVGRYHTLKEMDSIRIYNKKNWFRWSKRYDKGENGGSQIDFLKIFEGLEVKDAVFWLLDFAGYRRLEKNIDLKYQIREVREKEQKNRQEFILPEQSNSNKYLYEYLSNGRAISKKTIDYFVNKDLIYEAKAYHNIIFKGNDENGITRFASMRGVFDKDGKKFKCDVAGNDKHYGFNIVNDKSTEVVVFEAAIDLMSYVDIYKDYKSNKLALGMLADEPLITFLKEHKNIDTIIFCLDNDEHGRKASKALVAKYTKLEYIVKDCPPPKKFKDYNEWLVAIKLMMEKFHMEKLNTYEKDISKSEIDMENHYQKK